MFPAAFQEPGALCWQLLCSLLLGAGIISLLEIEMLEIRAMDWKALGRVGLIPFTAFALGFAPSSSKVPLLRKSFTSAEALPPLEALGLFGSTALTEERFPLPFN